MINKIVLVLSAASLLMIGCQESSTGVKTAKISGYEYEIYSAGDGAKVQEGEYVYFQMDVKDDKGTMLQSYRNQKVMPSVKIAPATDMVRKQNPIVDVLSHLSVGDSVAIIVPTDSIPNLPVGYEDVQSLNYVVVVSETMDEAAYKAGIAKQQEEEKAAMTKLKERLPEVSELTKKTLTAYKNGSLELEETPSGLKYHIHEAGTGDTPTKDRMLTMQYFGALVDSETPFDNSFDRGRGFSFRVGQGGVIPGWDEAALFLPIGTKASLFIPSELGYGERGYPPSIPANEELYFYVEAEELLY